MPLGAQLAALKRTGPIAGAEHCGFWKPGRQLRAALEAVRLKGKSSKDPIRSQELLLGSV